MTEAAKKILNFAKRKWLLIWLILAAAALCVVTVWAIYSTGSNQMGRVVRPITTVKKQAFSSNYLTTSRSTKNLERSQNSNSTDSYDVNVYLWNYDKSNPTEYYDSDITYTLTAQLTDSSGVPLTTLSENQYVKISSATNEALNKADDEGYVTLSGTNEVTLGESFTLNNNYDQYASPTGEDEDIFKLSFSSACYNSGVYVTLTAKPIDNSLLSLTGTIGITEQTKSISQGWSVTLTEESNTDDKSPDDYDGYNLVVQGSGTATITISINTSYLEPNLYFYDGTSNVYGFKTYESTNTTFPGKKEVEYKAPSGDSTIGTITINANPTVTDRSKYEIQLYKTGTKEAVSWIELFGTSDAAWVTYEISYPSTTENQS